MCIRDRIVSGILVILGLITMIQIVRGGANLGIDFSGGTAVQLKFDNPVAIDAARRALEKHDLQDVELQEFTQENKLLIRVKTKSTIEEKVAERIVQVFEQEFSHNKFVVDSSTEIGPTIGYRLQQDALLAITISLIGIILLSLIHI